MPTTKTPLLNLVAQYQSIQPEINAAIQRVLDSGHFILGDEVASLENEVAEYLGAAHGIGVASGTDALILALRALEIGPGDEVIIPAYTFFATAGAVLHVGARPVLVDIDPHTYCIDVEKMQAAISPVTKAVIPVHLYGHPAEMDAINAIAEEHGLKVIEDNAQAFGAEYKGRKTGALGDVGCLSFFPSKNLGGYGDGGMLVTDDPALADKLRMLRTHGWQRKYFPEILGYNSRLDALQGAILRVKLPHLDAWNDRRRELAATYHERLSGLAGLTTPYEAPDTRHVYHLYVLQLSQRDQLKGALKAAGIATGVYYPQPLHLTRPCHDLDYQEGAFPITEKASRETLAIPIYPEMTSAQVEMVAKTIKEVAV
ncbi:MAG: DegT/DnrJ/EryC1/StrS family aminotransferase [Anaerolineae bacterium]|nr:DegT/DnrJ/EryC1/StrS family aminotransferase [Anaerolineae bacterium]